MKELLRVTRLVVLGGGFGLCLGQEIEAPNVWLAVLYGMTALVCMFGALSAV